MKLNKTFATVMAGVALTATLGACTNYEEAQKEGFYSTGDRVGTVTKISKQGFRNSCKTWEGELAMDNFRSSGKSVSNTFSFTLRDESLVKKIQEAQETGARVKLHYNEVAFHNLCETNSGYFVESVTTVTAPAASAPSLNR